MDEQAEAAKKTALLMIPYGLYVLGAREGDEINAGTVNWVTQCSFQPPLVAIGVKRDSHLYAMLQSTPVFSLSFLESGQKDLAFAFFRPAKVEGDQITCEIVRLEGGYLTVRTRWFGTVNIEFVNVASLVSIQYFDVVRSDGSRIPSARTPPTWAAGSGRCCRCWHGASARSTPSISRPPCSPRSACGAMMQHSRAPCLIRAISSAEGRCTFKTASASARAGAISAAMAAPAAW